MNQRKPDAMDVAVGRRIRIERLARRMSQGELAAQIGVSFQQLQKYECGQNRVGAGRLTRIAEVLGVPVRALIEPDAELRRKTTRGRRGAATDAAALLALLAQPGAVRVVRAFTAIPRRWRAPVLSLLEQVARSRKVTARYSGDEPSDR